MRCNSFFTSMFALYPRWTCSLTFIAMVFALFSPAAQAEIHYKSWTLPNGWLEGRSFWLDLDGDGASEFFQVDGRRLSVTFAKNGDYSASHVAVFDAPSSCSYFTVSALEPDAPQRLLLLTTKGLSEAMFDPEAGTFQLRFLAAMPNVVLPHPTQLGMAKFAVDLDGDGADEIILPVEDGYAIYRRQDETWRKTGEVGRPQALRLSFQHAPLRQIHTFGPITIRSFQRSAFVDQAAASVFYFHWRQPYDDLTIRDVNEDGHMDIATPAFQYIQDAKGGFRPEGAALGQGVASEDPMLGEDPELGVTKYRLDVNGDGVVDEVSIETKSDFMMPKTKIQVRLGPLSAEEPTVFTMRTRSLIPNLSAEGFLQDINADGKRDLILLELNHTATSARDAVKAFMNRGMEADLQFYFWRDGEGYPRRPAYEFSMLLRQDIFGAPDLANAPFRIGHDFNGDGKPDLAIKTSAQSIAIHRLIDHKKGFEERPWRTIETPSPIDSYFIQTITDDGLADLLILMKDDNDPYNTPAMIYYSRR
ncbi:hypothetical protein JXA32_08060 [Candidatus Sumerlaeota bacterium]|nr:hypothetical protein [Candidatus Sumerlaeota bacterium]